MGFRRIAGGVLLASMRTWSARWRGLVAVAAVAWLPAALAAAGFGLAALTGCAVSEVRAPVCPVAGRDIGGLLYALVMMTWLVIPLLPVMLVTLAAAIVAAALTLVRACRRSRVGSVRARRRDARDGGLES